MNNIVHLDALPFVKSSKKREPRQFWHVVGSGDYGVDCQMGESFAHAFIGYAVNHGLTGGGILQTMVMHIVSKYGGHVPDDEKGLIVGMFYEIEHRLALYAMAAKYHEQNSLALSKQLAECVE